MNRVFLSYSRNDELYVSYLKKILHDNDLEIITIENNVVSDNSIKEAINNAIKAADIFILVFSKNSMNSMYFNYELNYSIGYLNNLKSRTIIPIVLDDVKLPFDISSIRYINIDKTNIEKSMDRVLAEVNKSLGRHKAEIEKKIEIAENVERNLDEYLDEPLKDLKKERKWL